MSIEPDLGLRPWLSYSCARTGIFVAAGKGALNEIRLDEDGAIGPTVPGIGLTRRLSEGIATVSSTRVLKTGGRWNNPCFNRGCRRTPPPHPTASSRVVEACSMRQKGTTRGIRRIGPLSYKQRGLTLFRRAAWDSRETNVFSPTVRRDGRPRPSGARSPQFASCTHSTTTRPGRRKSSDKGRIQYPGKACERADPSQDTSHQRGGGSCDGTTLQGHQTLSK